MGGHIIYKNLDAKILFDHQTCYYHETAGHFHVPGGSFHPPSAKFKLRHFFWGGGCSVLLLLKRNITLLSLRVFLIMYLKVIVIKRKKTCLLRYII